MSLFTGLPQFFDSVTGAPLSFGWVYFGEPNQDAKTSPKDAYTNNAYNVPLPNPLQLTAAGKFEQEVWLDGDYSIIVDDENSVQQEEYLLYPEPVGGGGGADWGDIGGTLSDQTDLQAELNGKQDVLSAGYGVDIASNVVSSDFATGNTASSYTLAVSNDNQWMDLTGSGTINITCPPESSVNLGAKFNHVISNYSSGTVTIVAGSGVTVRPPPGGTLVVPQYATIGIKKADYAADTYIVYGPTNSV